MSIKPIDAFHHFLHSIGLLHDRIEDRISSLALFSDLEKFAFCSSEHSMDGEAELLQKASLFDKIAIAEDQGRKEYLSKISFGKDEWFKYFGDVGDEPNLPDNIVDILESPCPIWRGRKKVSDTHLLVLIPSQVDGSPLTLNNLTKLVEQPKEGHATKYRYYWNLFQQRLGDRSVQSSYWVLFSKKIIPNSRGRHYLCQKKMMKSLTNKTVINYELPHALEAAICILMHHVRSGERLYSESPWVYTNCQETVQSYPIAIGCFSSVGLRGGGAHHSFGGTNVGGVGALCKL